MNTLTLIRIVTSILIVGFIIAVWTIPSNIYPKTDLEIYTPSNIYFIEGLRVTNERDSDTLTFDNMRSLKNYISDRTANDLEIQK